MPRKDIANYGKPFEKGDPRINRKGRPKLPDLKGAMAKVLAEEKDGMDALEAILRALSAKATKGDIRAAQELLDRGFGKPRQSIDAEVNRGMRITITDVSGKTKESIDKLCG
jgi:hypothetical protein